MNDFINGCFEFVGSLFLLINVSKLINDKTIKGVSAWPVVFWSIWGIWNLWFYPHVGCYWSFMGGLLVVSMNTTWIILLLHYRKKGYK